MANPYANGVPELTTKQKADMADYQSGNTRMARRLEAERQQKATESKAAMQRLAEERKRPSAEQQHVDTAKRGTLVDKIKGAFQ